MRFDDIKTNAKIFPGEYLLHHPSQEIVVCGAFKPSAGTIKALVNGRLLEDKIENFRQIYLTSEEKSRRRQHRRGCGGCKGR